MEGSSSPVSSVNTWVCGKIALPITSFWNADILSIDRIIKQERDNNKI